MGQDQARGRAGIRGQVMVVDHAWPQVVANVQEQAARQFASGLRLYAVPDELEAYDPPVQARNANRVRRCKCIHGGPPAVASPGRPHSIVAARSVAGKTPYLMRTELRVRRRLHTLPRS